MMNYAVEKIAGIDCVFIPMEGANSVTVKILVRAGIENEDKEQNGISHCLEHMFFKGGKRYIGEYELFKATDSIGAKLNGNTGMDMVTFFINTAPEFIGKAIDVLSDMIVDSNFRAEDFDREKKVIVQEMRRREDNPRVFASDQHRMWYIGDNSFGRYFTGTEENVMSFSVKDLEKYKDSLYTKDNLIIVIAGKNADSDFVKEQISLKFTELKEKRELSLPKYIEELPENHIKIIDKGLKQAQLMMSAKGFTEMDTKVYAADVLSSLLGGCRSSLLKSVIREQESLCYDISCDHLCSSDFGYFRIVSGLDNDKLEYGLDKINDVIGSIAKGDITEASFNDAVGFNIGRFSLDMQTPFAISGFVGRHYLLYKEITTIDDVINYYKTVSFEDVKKMCGMLSLENRYTLCVN